jgi:hypothetical protein
LARRFYYRFLFFKISGQRYSLPPFFSQSIRYRYLQTGCTSANIEVAAVKFHTAVN